jgi:hypothetical protein
MAIGEILLTEARMPTIPVSRSAVVAALTGLTLLGLPAGSQAATGQHAAALKNGSYAGSFHNVADAPSGSKAVTGKAHMVLSAHRTVVSLNARGLDPKAVYIAHVHMQPCSQDEGGTHFQFSPGGPMMPPNEIWLTPVKVNKQGKGTAKVTVNKRVNSDAKSVVIHLKRAPGATADEAKPPKLACANLKK